MMAGMDGLSTLEQIKRSDPHLPVVMITKNEEDGLLDEAIGRRIDDYLLKPVNPQQILSVIKRILESLHIREQKLAQRYIESYRKNADILIDPPDDAASWIELYLDLITWDIELESFPSSDVLESHRAQKKTANQEFGKFVERSYPGWIGAEVRPTLSVDIFANYIWPLYSRKGGKVCFIVVDGLHLDQDGLRLDQWLLMEHGLREIFDISREHYFALLPTATPYARNALFSGLFPAQIQKQFPAFWDESPNDDLGRNRFELELMQNQMSRLGESDPDDVRYFKIMAHPEAKELVRRFPTFMNVPLVALVFDFVDLLTHGRAQSDVIQEIIPDEAAFRALTRSWFLHSPLLELFGKLAENGWSAVVTSDHGSIRGGNAASIVADRETSTSPRYKYGSNLKVNPKQAVRIAEPELWGLPSGGITHNYVLAKEDNYFVYPNRFTEYQRLFQGSFQHGGISLEEMVVPVVTMNPKGEGE
jgi:hypothetical protein